MLTAQNNNLSSDDQTIINEEMNIFAFRIDQDANPSKNLEHLLSILSQHKMELTTDDDFTKEFDWTQKYTVSSITMKGSAALIAYNLNQIRPRLTDYISDYIGGPDSLPNKFYEIAHCKYLIREFAYETTIEEHNFLDPNKQYVLHFSKRAGENSLEIHASNLIFSSQAQAEITEHRAARINFFNLLFQLLDMKEEEIKMLNYKQQISYIAQGDKVKEFQLLEVWLALQKAGFISHLRTPTEIAAHRKHFFNCFNLIDRNFNNNKRNFYRNKTKGAFLIELHALIDSSPKIQKKIKKS